MDDLRVEPHPTEVDKPLGPNDVRVRVREGRGGEREGRDGGKRRGKIEGRVEIAARGELPGWHQLNASLYFPPPRGLIRLRWFAINLPLAVVAT